VLELRRVSKRFVGVVATDEVTLEVKSGEVHSLIGPNGAGKTTLISQISGTCLPIAGKSASTGATFTHARPYERVKLGLARSYQITSIFKRFTVLDNLALAVQARSGSSFSFWRPVAAEGSLFDEARSVAGENRSFPKTQFYRSYARPRRAARAGSRPRARHAPKLVLLDEPLAGMGPEEAQRMIRPDRPHPLARHGAPRRARHGRGVSPREPHLGAGERPPHRQRGARDHQGGRAGEKAYLGDEVAA